MQITRQIVADQVGAYLQHQLSLNELVDWAEQQILDGEFESTAVRDAVARLGVADVRAFGLTWEDTQRLLQNLGYAANVHIGTA
ncbi:MAG: hypothetical protein WD971_11900 [Pirellulales bacterium]